MGPRPVDYLDLYLMHQALDFKPGDNIFPIDENGQVIPGDADYVDTWKAMAECYKKGLVKSIGVSNFNRRQIERLLVMTKVVPVTNQVECHPYLSQKKLFEFCKSKGITITAHSTLGAPGSNYAKPNTPKVLEDAKIKAIAQKHNKTPAQVVLRWHIQRGIIAIPKSLNKNRINENIDIFDFQLTSDDIKQIDSMDCNGRMFALEWAKKHPYYPYNDEY
ncbi:aldose reductase-like [Agrilus planipennis]|uniref:Aldose reductase-like n=1 Tax=Agrilus planipennis TaxID=224129 RepID=A0A7F5QYQ7_AGRPL|nr:aldose reductase-like [Agrilus planipennis]